MGRRDGAGKPTQDPPETRRTRRRHFVIGWSMLFVFVLLGLFLEVFHGLKLRWYVDVNNATRRTMLTLAHAHGVLLGLLHIALAVSIPLEDPGFREALPSTLLSIASVLLPAGFLLGGIWIHQGDPGIGIFLTPIGGVALLASVGLMVRALANRR